MTYKIESIEDGSSKEYLFERGGNCYINTLNMTQEQPITPFSIPGQSATSTIILAFEGQKEYIHIDFDILDDGNAVDNGTDDSNPQTVQEQIDYLKTEIYKAGLSNIAFKIYGDEFDNAGTGCAIEDLKINRRGGEMYARGTFRLVVGAVT